jgi:hypothetical protein
VFKQAVLQPQGLGSNLISLLFSVWLALTPQTAFASNQMPTALYCIVSHESNFTQFDKDGSPLISPTGDVGAMQLNMATWLPLSKKMNLDIVHSEKDNITFGIYLYQKYGPTIWTTYRRYCSGSEAS